MDRTSAVERLYAQLSTFARSARELAEELHPGVTLVEYTLLSAIESRPDLRGVDIAAEWGIDKSTVSRQIDQLVADGRVERAGERSGRRGQALLLTLDGQRSLADADRSIRDAMHRQLTNWSSNDIARFGELFARFNEA